MATISQAITIALEHHQAGRLPMAEQIYRRVLDVDPKHAEAWHLLGVAMHQLGRHVLAVEYIRRAIELHPTDPTFHNNLGEVQRGLGQTTQAITCFRRALELKPDLAETQNNLGICLRMLGHQDEAIAWYRRAIALRPNYAEAYNNLALALQDQGVLAEAIACFRRALELRPAHAETVNNLGFALHCQGDLDQATDCYRRALELKPQLVEALNNLGNAYRDQGELEQAIACYRRALELRPELAPTHSNLIHTLVFLGDPEANGLSQELRCWNERHVLPLANRIAPHTNRRDPQRRLRIGYVSPDFCNHCQAFFTVPLLASHDHRQFEIFCYSDVAAADDITARLHSYADHWRAIIQMDADQAADCIRRDEIDILVDLTMHMAGSRLPVFARRPAPVQVCWLAYPGTTGLSTIDYRLTDPFLDPPGKDGPYTEESIRLGDSFWCYDPLTKTPGVSALPAAERGCVTFGSLNSFCKVSPEAMRLWAKVLRRVDGSRLMLLAAEGRMRERALEIFRTEGVAPERIEFFARQPRLAYLALHHQIDLGLDTWPVNGHTTSLDALWMGVPVVSLTGPTVMGRAGVCQLMNLGLPELVADTPERFVEIAAQWAGDLPRLASLRAELRQRMEKSPLMDACRFTRSVETAYRTMWTRWCEKPK